MLVSLIFDLFCIAWTWLTIRLKTKRHVFIRTGISLIFTLFSLVVVAYILLDKNVFHDDKTAFFIMLIMSLVYLLLWGIRLLFDLIFISKWQFESNEMELSKRINRMFHLNSK